MFSRIIITKPTIVNLTLYQTLEDRGNVEQIEDNGPHISKGNSNWLGHGYYFWDSHIELAHWWGEQRYASYIICKASVILDEKCWDLHNNGTHRIELEAILKRMVEYGIDKRENITLSKVIEFFKNEGTFKYDSIRMLGVNSMSATGNLQYSSRLPVVERKINRYLDLLPPIQFCLINKKSLSLRNYSVIFPVHYLETYG